MNACQAAKVERRTIRRTAVVRQLSSFPSHTLLSLLLSHRVTLLRRNYAAGAGDPGRCSPLYRSRALRRSRVRSRRSSLPGVRTCGQTTRGTLPTRARFYAREAGSGVNLRACRWFRSPFRPLDRPDTRSHPLTPSCFPARSESLSVNLYRAHDDILVRIP